MVGKPDAARDEYLSIEFSGLTRIQRQEALLGLSLSQSATGDAKEAQSAAEKALQLNPKSITAHHARIQLAQMKPFSAARTAELIELRNKAAARKWFSLENNIRLFLAQREERSEQRATLRQVIDSSHKTKDFYNRFRAIVDLFHRREIGESIQYTDRLTLVSAYHFYHNERKTDMFNKVHAILWDLFDEEADLQNLLSLFRHSSFIWRLSGDIANERDYLAKLKKRIDQITKSNLPHIGRDRVYFFARVSIVVLG